MRRFSDQDMPALPVVPGCLTTALLQGTVYVLAVCIATKWRDSLVGKEERDSARGHCGLRRGTIP